MGALYKRILLEDGAVEYEHRVIAERMLGRKLKPGEEVHHIDENKRNNNEKNLIVFESCADHIRFHQGGTLIKNNDGTYKSIFIVTCQECGTTFSGKKSGKFCSIDCCKKNARKVDRPLKEELVSLLKNGTFTSVGRMYGVNGNTIKKWCRGYGISDKASDYKDSSKKKDAKSKKSKRLLTLEQANEIRRLRVECNYSQSKLGEMFGVARETIRDILLNKSYRN